MRNQSVKTQSELLALILLEKKKGKTPLIVMIDGDCGSGKTTLANWLADQLDANLLHVDDFYLPRKLRTKARFSRIGGNIHTERIVDMLIDTVQGNPINYQKYNPVTDVIEQGVILQPAEITIVEGSYSLLPTLNQFTHFSIFLQISSTEQTKRLLVREGETKFSDFKNIWIPREKKYHKYYQVKAMASVILETTNIK